MKKKSIKISHILLINENKDERKLKKNKKIFDLLIGQNNCKEFFQKKKHQRIYQIINYKQIDDRKIRINEILMNKMIKIIS